MSRHPPVCRLCFRQQQDLPIVFPRSPQAGQPIQTSGVIHPLIGPEFVGFDLLGCPMPHRFPIFEDWFQDFGLLLFWPGGDGSRCQVGNAESATRLHLDVHLLSIPR